LCERNNKSKIGKNRLQYDGKEPGVSNGRITYIYWSSSISDGLGNNSQENPLAVIYEQQRRRSWEEEACSGKERVWKLNYHTDI
jgi:hypothetical protein